MMGNKGIHIALFFALFILAGCSLGGSKQEAALGSQGLTMSFLPFNPPDVIRSDYIDNSFNAIIEIKNQGTFPQPEEGKGALKGRIYLSGFDKNIIHLDPESFDLSKATLYGRSTINQEGLSDLITFKGTVFLDNLNVEKYEPILLATVCYNYQTIAGPSVCIDPDPYSEITTKKVCNVKDLMLP